MIKKIFVIFCLCLFISLVSAEVRIGENSDKDFGVGISTIKNKIRTFLGLDDTPSSYAGQGNKCLAVNAGETGVDFVACSVASGGGNFNISEFHDSFFLNASFYNDTWATTYNSTYDKWAYNQTSTSGSGTATNWTTNGTAVSIQTGISHINISTAKITDEDNSINMFFENGVLVVEG